MTTSILLHVQLAVADSFDIIHRFPCFVKYYFLLFRHYFHYGIGCPFVRRAPRRCSPPAYGETGTADPDPRDNMIHPPPVCIANKMSGFPPPAALRRSASATPTGRCMGSKGLDPPPVLVLSSSAATFHLRPAGSSRTAHSTVHSGAVKHFQPFSHDKQLDMSPPCASPLPHPMPL